MIEFFMFKVQLKMSAYLFMLKYEDYIMRGSDVPSFVLDNLEGSTRILSNLSL